MEPDRVWLLTPPGPGAIAVIRLSGDGVAGVLARFFSRQLKLGRCVHGELRDEQGVVIDDPVVVLVDAKTLDINLHGGGAIIRTVLALAKRAGFSEEQQPIYSAAADVIEQEMRAALPLAKTKLGLSMLLSQPAAWATAAWTPDSAREALADRSLWWLLNPPTVAIIGQANVGKSTLANALFGCARSIVFDQPGTTRDYVSDLADLNGLPVHLIDTPGQRLTDDPIEAAAIKTSQAMIDQADLRLLVLDQSTSLSPQLDLLEKYQSADHTLVVINKSDLKPLWNFDASAIRLVAVAQDTVAALIQRISEHFINSIDPLTPRFWTERQRLHLQQVLAAIA